MPQASTLSEPKTGVVPPVRTTKNEPTDADDAQPKTGSSFERVDVSHFSSVDILDYPVSFYIQVIACRRSGKSFTVNWMLQQYQKSDKAFDAIFLFSPTDAGFEGIPKKFRYKTLDPIESIMNQQRQIKKHNMKAKKAEDKIKSRVLLVIDDCASGDAMKSCKSLEYLALNGRHLGNDGVDGNGLSVFVLSQSVTKCSRATRLNCDVWLTNSIASARERELLLDETFFLSTARDAKRHARAKTSASSASNFSDRTNSATRTTSGWWMPRSRKNTNSSAHPAMMNPVMMSPRRPIWYHARCLVVARSAICDHSTSHINFSHQQ
jgi:hypothetical protein